MMTVLGDKLKLGKRVGRPASLDIMLAVRPLLARLRALASEPAALSRAQARLRRKGQRLERAKQRVERKDRRIAALETALLTRDAAGIRPENIIWMFGFGRTGSSWLGTMLGDLDGYAIWSEPFVGEIFGSAYFLRAWDWQRKRPHFAMSQQYEDVWLGSMRTLVLDGAKARFPGMTAEHTLVIREPHGSVGAPLLMRALPESRMIFLVRDPRDVTASALDAQRKGSWTSQFIDRGGKPTLADTDPDEFVRRHAGKCLLNIGKASEAYRAHAGSKVLVRYEDLRADTLGELDRICAALRISLEPAELRATVEKHAWDNVPAAEKGAGKARRKATPGGWREDLTAAQARTVEDIAAPVFREFYGDHHASEYAV